MPPRNLQLEQFFWRTHFRSGIKKICLSVFTGCQGLAGRKFFQPIWHRNCTRDSKLDLSMHCSQEGPPMMDPSTDLLPAQKLAAGDAQKLTFRFLNVSEKFSWKIFFTKKIVQSLPKLLLIFFDEKRTSNDQNLNNAIFDLESFFL